MCLKCELGTLVELPFLYCHKCCKSNLDSSDPTMNLDLLRLLVGLDPKELLVELGHE